MPKYITVLDSDLGHAVWLAIEWGDDLAALLKDSDYNAANNTTFPKKAGYVTKGNKKVKEISSGLKANATVIQL